MERGIDVQDSSAIPGGGGLNRFIEKVLSCTWDSESLVPCLSLLIYLSTSAKENGRKSLGSTKAAPKCVHTP